MPFLAIKTYLFFGLALILFTDWPLGRTHHAGSLGATGDKFPRLLPLVTLLIFTKSYFWFTFCYGFLVLCTKLCFRSFAIMHCLQEIMYAPASHAGKILVLEEERNVYGRMGDRVKEKRSIANLRLECQ